MSANNNVIVFPGSKRPVPEGLKFDEDESLSNILDVKINHINEALFVIIPQLFNNLEMMAPSMDGDDDVKDVNLIVESIKSLLFKQYGIEHPFQKLSDAVFIVNDEKEININNFVNLDFSEFIKEE